jgi:hypothetical protein
MASPERQQLIGAAVVDAVDGFCVAQSHQPAPQIAQRSKSRHVLSAHSRRHVRERTATSQTSVMRGLLGGAISALPPKADIERGEWNVRQGSIGDTARPSDFGGLEI